MSTVPSLPEGSKRQQRVNRSGQGAHAMRGFPLVPAKPIVQRVDRSDQQQPPNARFSTNAPLFSRMPFNKNWYSLFTNHIFAVFGRCSCGDRRALWKALPAAEKSVFLFTRSAPQMSVGVRIMSFAKHASAVFPRHCGCSRRAIWEALPADDKAAFLFTRNVPLITVGKGCSFFAKNFLAAFPRCSCSDRRAIWEALPAADKAAFLFTRNVPLITVGKGRSFFAKNFLAAFPRCSCSDRRAIWERASGADKSAFLFTRNAPRITVGGGCSFFAKNFLAAFPRCTYNDRRALWKALPAAEKSVFLFTRSAPQMGVGSAQHVVRQACFCCIPTPLRLFSPCHMGGAACCRQICIPFYSQRTTNHCWRGAAASSPRTSLLNSHVALAVIAVPYGRRCLLLTRLPSFLLATYRESLLEGAAASSQRTFLLLSHAAHAVIAVPHGRRCHAKMCFCLLAVYCESATDVVGDLRPGSAKAFLQFFRVALPMIVVPSWRRCLLSMLFTFAAARLGRSAACGLKDALPLVPMCHCSTADSCLGVLKSVCGCVSQSAFRTSSPSCRRVPLPESSCCWAFMAAC